MLCCGMCQGRPTVMEEHEREGTKGVKHAAVSCDAEVEEGLAAATKGGGHEEKAQHTTEEA